MSNFYLHDVENFTNNNNNIRVRNCLQQQENYSILFGKT